MSQRIVFIQGGGLGFEQEKAARKLLTAVGLDCTWQTHFAGQAATERGLDPLPAEMLTAARAAGIVLKTKIIRPVAGDFGNLNVELRRELGLFAAVRPLRNLRGLRARFNDIDILLVREITEDLYAAIEHEIVPGVVQSIKVVTEAACRRFFEFTFNLAQRSGRKSVHCVHKANILKLADGLFLDCFRQVAKRFPDIQPKEIIVDNCCMQLVTRPSQFEVLAAGNLYGDILSDLGAGLMGGITLAEGINYGDNLRVYECIHGGPRGVVQADQVNPLTFLFAALSMYRDLGHEAAAHRLQRAVENVLVAGEVRTPDLGGTASTGQMVDAILRELDRLPAA